METGVQLTVQSNTPELIAFSRECGKLTSITRETAEKTIKNLLNLGVETYRFSYCSNLIARAIGRPFIDLLETILEEFRSSSIGDLTLPIDCYYCCYYIVSYYYRTHDKMDELRKVIDLNERFFLYRNCNYALLYQIRGRLYRRIGDVKQAIECDKKAIRLLTKKNLSNIGVNITLASSISIALENREDFIEKSDVERSIKYVRSAIEEMPLHGRYYFLLAKIQMFALIRFSDDDSFHMNYQAIKDIKALFLKAIELDDELSKSHSENIIEYKSYLREADLILAEAHLLDKIHQQEDRITKLIEKDYNDNQKSFESKLRDLQGKYLEILSLFVSVIAIVMSIIGTFNNAMSTSDIVLINIGMCSGVLAVYSSFIILLREVRLKYIVSLVICVATEALVFWLSLRAT